MVLAQAQCDPEKSVADFFGWRKVNLNAGFTQDQWFHQDNFINLLWESVLILPHAYKLDQAVSSGCLYYPSARSETEKTCRLD